ncbi:MAG: recombinase zinc beta ribbon domain-containing protein [Nitrospirae bacterium]|nr:recombinase zinc beta ribbon domain-containing protein [Nitrospirota bacterium]
MLNINNVTKTGYRQDNNKSLLKGLVYCGSCHSAMTPSFSLSKGKEYYYYRCLADNDRSKKQCHTGSVNARQIENLVIEELKFLAREPEIIEGVVESATKEQKEKVKELAAKKKTIQESLNQADKKAKNLMNILGEAGKDGERFTYIMKELNDLEDQASGLKKQIDYITFEMNNLENKIIDANAIRDNFKVFRDVFNQLTQDEKYDLMHLLIKKVVYYEDAKYNGNGVTGDKTGKIKMDLWELPPIDPHNLNSANGFAESNAWLPGRDSNPRHGG